MSKHDPSLRTQRIALERRYQLFRPWMVDAKVLDLGPNGEWGVDYASRIAASATRQSKGDDVDVALALGLLPEELQSLDLEGASLHGKWAVSVDRPFEAWAVVATRAEMEAVRKAVESAACKREVHWITQLPDWPMRFVDGMQPRAASWIACVAENGPPKWPKLGIAIPTVDNPNGAKLTIGQLTRVYPGEISFALVANGSSDDTLEALRGLPKEIDARIELIEESANRGYGVGCNVGLARLRETGDVDYFGVCNDDVVPALECVCEMVSAMLELERLGHRPGLIGPVSNNVNGAQKVEIGHYQSVDEMFERASLFHRDRAASATQTIQVRGLFLLMHPDCLGAIGGFDPRFGIGNFEDDDWNLRAKLAGFTAWIADGAFLHHEGSATFRKLGVDYRANIERNALCFLDKWRLDSVDSWPQVEMAPDGVSLFVPLDARLSGEEEYGILVNGEPVHLIEQASELEFAAWIVQQLRARPREDRKAVVAAIRGRVDASKAA